MTTPFISRDAWAARANLAAFIEKYRALGAWGLGKEPFESEAWKYDGLAEKGKRGYIYFARLGYNANKHMTKHGQPSLVPEASCMPPLFGDFARAMLAHLHLTQPSTNVNKRADTLRFLLAALQRLDPDPSEMSVADLEAVCDLLRKWGPANKAVIGLVLAVIWRAMVDLELVQAPATWECPLKMKSPDDLKLGPEFDAKRHKKLPDPRALDACAALFCRDDLKIRAKLASRYVALALCAPERCGEFLFAPADLIDPWIDPDTGEEGVALRWFPEKGGRPQTKNVPLELSPIARRAYNDLHALTQPARDLAKWYEDNPTRMYLPSHLEYLRDKEIIDINEAHAALYGGEVRLLDTEKGKDNYSRRFLRKNQVLVTNGAAGKWGSRSATLHFADLEQVVLRQLPEGFPIMDPQTGMKYSQALCVLRRGEFGESEGHDGMPAILQALSRDQLYGAMGNVAQSSSIFVQHGLTGPNGAPLRITSHQLRHYLNTIVRRGDKRLTEEEIALWSGRKDVSQNPAYDHKSDNDRAHEVEVRYGFRNDILPFGDAMKTRVFVRRDEFGNIEKITAHITEWGFCLHDYIQSPCPIMKNCIECREHVCIKGDARARKVLELLYADSHALTEAAQRDAAAGTQGADDWFSVHLKNENLFKQLLEIFESADVPDGTPIYLTTVETPNPIKQALARRTIPIMPVAQKIQSMSDVTLLLAAPAANNNTGESHAA
ncbi:MAG: hypothetical protein WC100_08320 [Sterolibacterium sp.]